MTLIVARRLGSTGRILAAIGPVLTALLLYRESSDRTLAAILLAILIVPGMMLPELLAHALGTCLQ